MGKDKEKKTWGTNIDFNSYGLRPAGSYLSDAGKVSKIKLTLTEPSGEKRTVDVPDMASLQSTLDRAVRNTKNASSMDREIDRMMDEAKKANAQLMRELGVKDEAALGAGAPKTEAEKSPERPNLEELLRELDALVGLDSIKKNVRSLINLAKVRKLREEQGLPTPAMSLHLVFMGNPGTGKTTVARLIAQLYYAIGVLSKGQLVEVDRSGLVAGFVGQTAIKTDGVIKKAIGGVLFIDEAYALTAKGGENDFGGEAIETILKAMEDNRKDLVVIVAGYEELMERFIDSNPGLQSRFNRYFVFEDYTGEQLYDICLSMCKKNRYQLTVEAQEFLRRYLQTLYETREENFGNARDVRNLFENVISVHADRVAQLPETSTRDLTLVAKADVEKAAAM